MRNSQFVRIAVVVTVAVATSGCYTLLKHPRVKRVVYEEVHDKRCNGCHASEELWDFHHPPNHLYDYGGYAAWSLFYDVPWWYNDYWYYDADAPEAVPLRSRKLRPDADRSPTSSGGAVRRARRIKSPPPVKNKETGADSGKSRTTDEPSKKRTDVRPKRQKPKRKPPSDD